MHLIQYILLGSSVFMFLISYFVVSHFRVTSDFYIYRYLVFIMIYCYAEGYEIIYAYVSTCINCNILMFR